MLLLGLTKGNGFTSYTNVYSETVYRDIIHRESKRCERSDHLCRILLIYHTCAQGRVLPFRAEVADKTISVLSSGCRDTDYIGWYRQGRILGVLLTALRPDSSGERHDNLKARLVESLRGIPTSTDDHSLQIRVLEERELTTFDASNHSVPSPGSTD